MASVRRRRASGRVCLRQLVSAAPTGRCQTASFLRRLVFLFDLATNQRLCAPSWSSAKFSTLHFTFAVIQFVCLRLPPLSCRSVCLSCPQAKVCSWSKKTNDDNDRKTSQAEDWPPSLLSFDSFDLFVFRMFLLQFFFLYLECCSKSCCFASLASNIQFGFQFAFATRKIHQQAQQKWPQRHAHKQTRNRSR